MRNVTLDSGVTVTVYPVPPFVIAAVRAKFYDPPIPPGDIESKAWREWYMESEKRHAARDKSETEAALLIALQDIEPPSGWSLPKHFVLAGIEPREGDRGKTLDYIQYELIKTPKDLGLIQAAMYGEQITDADIESASAMFLDSGKRKAADRDTTR